MLGMKRLILALGLFGFVFVTAAPAQGDRCSSRHHTWIPKLVGQIYDDARVKLIAAGWKPLQTNDESSAETNLRFGNGPYFWKEKHYFEVTVCGADFAPGCEFVFVDKQKNELHVETYGMEDQVKHTHAIVKHSRILCDLD